jgi:hypothetical protein
MPGRTVRWKVTQIHAGKGTFLLGATIDSHVLEQEQFDQFVGVSTST